MPVYRLRKYDVGSGIRLKLKILIFNDGRKKKKKLPRRTDTTKLTGLTVIIIIIKSTQKRPNMH